MCGCSECWTTVVWGPLADCSPRPAAKQRKLKEVISALPGHKWQESKNLFVFQTYGYSENFTWSPNGRYMYNFSKKLDLMIVDLLRRTFKPLKPRTEWYRSPELIDVVFVGPFAILVSIYIEDGDRDELHLLRLTKEGDDYERILLHRAYDRGLSAFALVEITGEGVEVKRAVAHCGSDGPMIFLMVAIDEARAVVVDNVVPPFHQTEEREFVAVMSADGRQLLAIREDAPHVLQVYSLAERKWTRRELDGRSETATFSPSGLIYAQGDKNDWEFLFRCDVKQKKWERVPVEARDINDVAFVVNPADGREDGVVFCRMEQEEEPQGAPDQAVERFQFERRMFRNPDSLLRQSFVAVRCLREGVNVEEVIRELVDAATKAQKKPNMEMSSAVLQKKFFSSAYDGMTPIPVRFHQ
ncbi:hypothetical protein M3Y99_01954900 [Aphelenchoides fujianensis]|nr:hypothetical protein M3Y99_01954900 [Aphelenchoides fujianensis]